MLSRRLSLVSGDLRRFDPLDPVDVRNEPGNAVQTVSGSRKAGDKARHLRGSVGSPLAYLCAP